MLTIFSQKLNWFCFDVSILSKQTHFQNKKNNMVLKPVAKKVVNNLNEVAFKNSQKFRPSQNKWLTNDEKTIIYK